MWRWSQVQKSDLSPQNHSNRTQGCCFMLDSCHYYMLKHLHDELLGAGILLAEQRPFRKRPFSTQNYSTITLVCCLHDGQISLLMCWRVPMSSFKRLGPRDAEQDDLTCSDDQVPSFQKSIFSKNNWEVSADPTYKCVSNTHVCKVGVASEEQVHLYSVI